MTASPCEAASASLRSAKGIAWIWHLSDDLQLAADFAGEIDVETGKLAVLVGKIEGREIDRRQEAQADQRREIRLGKTFA